MVSQRISSIRAPHLHLHEGASSCLDLDGAAVQSPLILLEGDALTKLRELSAGSVHCCVTSPPYWQMRDYELEPLIWNGVADCPHEFIPLGKKTAHPDRSTSGEKDHHGNGKYTDRIARGSQPAKAARGVELQFGELCSRCGCWRGSLGLEPTVDLYIEHLVQIFREVRRVLRRDATLWLNLGDTFTKGRIKVGKRIIGRKNLVGIPWRTAIALQEDGWYLRRDHIWEKPTVSPESAPDRCTTSHEYLFLLSKSDRYYYDLDAIKEPTSGNAHSRGKGVGPKAMRPVAGWAYGAGAHTALAHNRPGRDGGSQKHALIRGKQNPSYQGTLTRVVESRNRRSVWKIAAQPYKGAHFATFPTKLVEPCVLAGSASACCSRCEKPHRNGLPNCDCRSREIQCVVMDCFAGTGTVGKVALELGRRAILIEINPNYVEMIKDRCTVEPDA
ncbi:MAG: site-specific DNA-methyltransferase [Acidobacteriota bacterium]